jgi:hypothetical protein
MNHTRTAGWLVVLLVSVGVFTMACDDSGDDDDAGDDNECIACETTAECTAAFGAGWGCQSGCCIEIGDDDADDDSGDDDSDDDDNDGSPDDDDDDNDDDVSPGEVSFVTENVDRAAPGNRQTALVLTDDGRLHAAYTGCSDGPCARSELFYAERTDAKAEWVTTSVDARDGDTGWMPCLAIEPNGHIYLVYENHDRNHLYWAHKPSGGQWASARVGSGRTLGWTSCALTPSGLVAAHTRLPASGYDNSWLEVALYDGAWSFDDADPTANSGYYTAMDVTSDGRPVILFVLSPVYPSGSLKIAEWTGTEWNILTIDEGTYGGGIAIDLDGYYHLAYSKNDPIHDGFWDLWYATNAPSGTWTKFALDPGENEDDDTGGFPAIAVDAQNGLHVTYRSFYQNALRYARNLNGTWELYTADPIGSGMYSSLAIDDDGGVHVIYEGGAQIHYAYCATCAPGK